MTTMASNTNTQFPCSMLLNIPFPTSRLADTALKALQVDPELSQLVTRNFSVVPAPQSSSDDAQILKIEYMATTNRMLRVAVNSFMDSLKLVLEVMEQLDTDVLDHRQEDGL
ncbi:transcription factor Pcc1-domain-containing protein [Mariannaea sp. PMI_226]|nr:transcription factor Pcc1-domain-containing protein [Mariannaea sp. PMI_226]